MNDTVINKVQSIERCIGRAREEYRLAAGNFQSDLSRQDAAILNVTRACEQAKKGKEGVRPLFSSSCR